MEPPFTIQAGSTRFLDVCMHPECDEDVDIEPEPNYHTNDDHVDTRDIAKLSKN